MLLVPPRRSPPPIQVIGQGRNLSPDQLSLIRGRRYNRAKKAAQFVAGGKGGPGRGKTGGQNVPPLKTATRLAKQHNVDEKTIRRDGQFAAAVEKVKAVPIGRVLRRRNHPPS